MIKNRTPHDQLLSLQRKIYRSLSEQTQRLLGEQPESIRAYERDYQKEFKHLPKSMSVLSRDALIEKIADTQVTLIGDFHTFSQAQRTALRILRNAQKNDSKPRQARRSPMILGLEIFASHRQPILDDFQNGKISEEKFLKAVHYDDWGFPWENYRPLIQWAIAHSVKLVALNRPTELGTELDSRDQWAAGILTDLFLKAPALRVFVLYGELHLGHNHLPRELAKTSKAALGKQLSTIVIHQNQEAIYWRMAKSSSHRSAEILKLSEKRYCVLSSTPWNKLQSVVNWAEGSFPTPIASNMDDDIDFYDDTFSSIRLVTLMQDFARIQSKFFGLAPPSLESLNVYTIENADYFNSVNLAKLKPVDRGLLKFHIRFNERVYLPESELIYLATPTENSTAEIAAMHLLNCSLQERKLGEPFYEHSGEDFYRWVLSAAFGFLGSLILNPRRKCDLIDDHRERLKVISKSLKPTHPEEIQARKLALILLEAKNPEDPKAIAALSAGLENGSKRAAPIALFLGAKFVGQALAKSLHQSLVGPQSDVTLDEVKRCFFGEDSLPPAYWRYVALRKLAHLETHARSKNETL